MHEVLLNKEEMAIAEDLQDYYKIPPDLRDMNYGKYVEDGNFELNKTEEYSSSNTEQLNTSNLKELLLKVEFVRSLIEQRNIKTPT